MSKHLCYDWLDYILNRATKSLVAGPYVCEGLLIMVYAMCIDVAHLGMLYNLCGYDFFSF